VSNVIIELAHHLDAGSAERLGLPAKDLLPTTEVVVAEDVARALIGAGYAAVETERPEQVAKALRRKAPAGHAVGLYEAPDEDQGEPAKADAPAVSAPVSGAAPKRTGK
jgi:hypothetical protein